MLTRNMKSIINELLISLPPITLQQMNSIRLMNRTDTKYIMSTDKLPLFLQLAQADYYVQEIGDKRVSSYHTVYYDTEDEAMFIAHQNGRRVREKVRVRTYQDSNQSFLEIKHKNNKGRTNKKRMPVDNIEIGENEEASLFLSSNAWHELSVLNKKIENNFYRITLVNRNKTERLTIDYNIQFRNLQTGLTAQIENLVIVELKRDGYATSPILYVLRQLNVKPVSISKYCVGSVMTNPQLKYNRFKEKLRQINKLTNQQPLTPNLLNQ